MKSLQYFRFAHEYCGNGYDPRAAAISAGYSKKSAQQAGYRLLAKPEVQEIIEEHKASIRASAMVKHKLVIYQLQLLAFASIKDYVAINPNGSLRYKPKEEISWESGTAVNAIKSNSKGETVSIELQPKIEALALLADLCGSPENEQRASSD